MSTIPTRYRLVLASSSPRRQSLLSEHQALLWPDADLLVQPSAFDERLLQGQAQRSSTMAAVQEYVRSSALLKAAHVIAQRSEDGPEVVLGADTVIALDTGDRLLILEKPTDEQDAIRMLRMMSGRVHHVLTGVALLTKADVEAVPFCTWDASLKDLLPAALPGSCRADAFVCDTAVTFAKLQEEQIAAYVRSGEPMDKAGSYAIQGRGVAFVKALDGCFTNVVGLPLQRVAQHLRPFEAAWRSD